MENAINQISCLLGPLITKDELREQALNAARILFPSCHTAELVISNSRERSIDCPMEVLMREIRNATNGDITIKKLTNEFATNVVAALSDRPITHEVVFNSALEHELVSFYLPPPKSFIEQNAQFILIADTLPCSAMQRARILRDQLAVALNRIDRLEQMQINQNFASITSPKPDRKRELCCSRGVYDTPTPTPSDSLQVLKFFESLSNVNLADLQGFVMQRVIRETDAETGFLVMQIPDTTEFVCNFAGNKQLTEPMCIDMNDDLFTDVILSKSAVHLAKPKDSQLRTLAHILLSNTTQNDSTEHSSEHDMSLTDELNMRSLLLHPLYNQTSLNMCGVVCLLNKQSEPQFNSHDEQTVQSYFKYTLPLLRCSLAYQNEQVIKARTEEMLKVAGNIFTHMMDLTDLLLKIMQEARNLTKAERCSVFLLEPETKVLVAKVLDGLPTATNKNTKFVTPDGQTVTLPEEIRIATTQGIAGYVATTGEILNIKDAYTHPLFYRGVDEETGFHTRNILCFPIKNEKNGIVGVAQLCNKIDFPYFTHADEDVARAFSVYCCISIVHSLMYKNVQDAQHRTRLANELMMYHMQISEDKVQWLSTCRIPPMKTILDPPSAFASVPRNVTGEDDTFLACLSMFEELGLITQWRISRKTLARFVLMVRRGYRDPAYHNWMHAFSVCHFVYVCGMNLPLAGDYLTKLEFLALFVASLCHDIDHRGTNNSFQLQSKSTLAALYSSEGSVLERHHFSQTICILNTNDCNVLESLSEQEYSQILDLIRDIILATDLAHHLNILPNLVCMAQTGYDRDSPKDHNLLLCLLMTAADLSDQTKNWSNTVQVAKLIYEEFFSQGDLEKALGHSPADSMDRERACVPALQISFLDYIISPLYEVFAQMFPDGKDFLVTINSNRIRWKTLEEKVRNGEIDGNGLAIFTHDLLNEAHFET